MITSKPIFWRTIFFQSNTITALKGADTQLYRCAVDNGFKAQFALQKNQVRFFKSLYFNFVFSSILVFVTRWEYLAIDEGFIRTRINWKSMCYLFHCYYAQSRVLCFWRRGRSSNAFTFFPYKVHLINHDMAARVIQKHHRIASAVILAGRRKKNYPTVYKRWTQPMKPMKPFQKCQLNRDLRKITQMLIWFMILMSV